jgi:uncharacterized protein (DUF608 family)
MNILDDSLEIVYSQTDKQEYINGAICVPKFNIHDIHDKQNICIIGKFSTIKTMFVNLLILHFLTIVDTMIIISSQNKYTHYYTNFVTSKQKIIFDVYCHTTLLETLSSLSDQCKMLIIYDECYYDMFKNNMINELYCNTKDKHISTVTISDDYMPLFGPMAQYFDIICISTVPKFAVKKLLYERHGGMFIVFAIFDEVLSNVVKNNMFVIDKLDKNSLYPTYRWFNDIHTKICNIEKTNPELFLCQPYVSFMDGDKNEILFENPFDYNLDNVDNIDI